MSKQKQNFNERQVMKNKSFEVFHYFDSASRNVELHDHSFYEIYFFLSGNVNFSIEGIQYELKSGDILLISPTELHCTHSIDGKSYERIVLWINRDYLSSLSNECDLSSCFPLDNSKRSNLLRLDDAKSKYLLSILEKLNYEFYESDYASNVYAKSLLMQFMVELNRSFMHSSITKQTNTNSLVHNIIEFIDKNFCDDINLDKLAQKFYISKSYLCHEFHNQVGTSVYRYIILRRLTYARELLIDGNSPGVVFHLCGFSDYANFYRLFKQEYGVSPSKFSNKND